MVFRLGLNGLKGAGEEPGLSGFCFGVVGCDKLGVALSWSAGDGSARITEQIVFLPLKLYEVWIHLQVHTHELHSNPLAADHLFKFGGGLTSGTRGVYRIGPPNGCLNLGFLTFMSAT